MSDSLKSKNSPWSSSHGSNSNVASSQGNWDFSPQANLEAQLLASPNLVSSVKDTCSWLEKKGWMLNSEDYTKNKLADIFFSASLLFKHLLKANITIHSVTYLIQDLAEEEHTTSLTDKIIDWLTNRLNEPILSLNMAVSLAKNFLNATSQQYATDLLC